MDQPYTFTWHPAEGILEVTLMGMWSAADVQPYYQALTQYVMDNITTQFQVLTDLRQYPVQNQEVAALHTAIMSEVQQNSPVTREAWLVAGIVATMQATRGARNIEQAVNIFTDRDDAWAYLTTPVAA